MNITIIVTVISLFINVNIFTKRYRSKYYAVSMWLGVYMCTMWTEISRWHHRNKWHHNYWCILNTVVHLFTILIVMLYFWEYRWLLTSPECSLIHRLPANLKSNSMLMLKLVHHLLSHHLKEIQITKRLLWCEPSIQQSDCALIKMIHPLSSARTNGIIYSPLLFVHIYQAV